VDLDYQGDPAWECLVLQKDWLLKLLANCQEDHKSKGKNSPYVLTIKLTLYFNAYFLQN